MESQKPNNAAMGLLAFYIIILSMILLFFSGCNPAKKVLKNKEDFDKVGREWAKKNPCNNDTVIVSNSDTVVSVATKVDTLNEYTYYRDTIAVFVPKTIVKTSYKTITIKDTVISYVADNRRLEISKDETERIRWEWANTLTDLQKYKGRATTYFVWILLLIGLIIGFAAFKIFKKK